MDDWETGKRKELKMDFSYLLRGLIIGFSVAMVLGPIGMLCIQRTVQRGFRAGLVTGLGAATADGLYGSIAAFGLTLVSGFLVSQQVWIRLVGGLFLLYLGVKAALTPPATKAAEVEGSNLLVAYSGTLLLTLTNPLTILSFVAIFAGAGLVIGHQSVLAAGLMVVGVFSGSAVWWVILSGGIHLVRERMTTRWLVWVNRLAGTMIMGFGLYTLIGLMLQII
jgi:threonine/homoserine/homoserine lactone efflux protein